MRIVYLAALLLLAVSVQSGKLQAGELQAKSSIVGVTVFPSGAEIVRAAKVELVAGDHVIVIDGLPERLIDSSLRVEGEGDKAFEIGSVDSKRLFVDVVPGEGVLDKTERARIEKEIERLGDEASRLSARIKTAQTQRALMERLTDLPGHPPSTPVARPLPEGGVSVSASAMKAENWGALFDLIGTRMNVADDLIWQHRQARRATNKDIAKLKKRLSHQPGKKERQTQLRVAVAAGEALSGTLKIKYQVREASWRPYYDARLATAAKEGAKPELKLTRRAGIRQWTGEDWTTVKLVLSTTSPQKGAQAPILHPQELDLLVPRPVASGPVGMFNQQTQDSRQLRSLRRGMAEDKMAMAPAMEAAPAPKKVMAVNRGARVRQYGFQAVFEIPGAVTITARGDEKKVAINSVDLKPELKIRAVPKLNKTAFLYAKFTHGQKMTALLPGRVALYRDGTFTGNGHLPLVNSGDTHELGFGADDAIKVERSELKRTKGETGILTTSKLDERRYSIKVTNLHKTPVAVEVLDQIPYSVNEKVIVTRLPATTKPSRKDVDKKRGILAWDFTLAPGKDKEVTLAYSISWPADAQLRR